MLKLTFTLHPTRVLIILVHVTSLILWFTLMKPSWKIWWYLINLWKNYLILFPLSIVRSTWMMTCTSLFLHEMSIGWNIPTKPMIHLLKEILKMLLLIFPSMLLINFWLWITLWFQPIFLLIRSVLTSLFSPWFIQFFLLLINDYWYYPHIAENFPHTQCIYLVYLMEWISRIIPVMKIKDFSCLCWL